MRPSASPAERPRVTPTIRRCAIAALLTGAVAAPAGADIFVLHSRGEVHGKLVNRDESPRKTYVIKTTSGGQVTLPPSR